jgi:hypothetical protein
MRMARLLSLAIMTVSLGASVPVGAQQPVAPRKMCQSPRLAPRR